LQLASKLAQLCYLSPLAELFKTWKIANITHVSRLHFCSPKCSGSKNRKLLASDILRDDGASNYVSLCKLSSGGQGTSPSQMQNGAGDGACLGGGQPHNSNKITIIQEIFTF
jgi:hypothetical protein